jgi:pilus assembly protein Flp/PilA
MLDFKKLFKKGNEEEEGQGLVEYALILFLVAVVVIAILILLGPQIGSVFSAVTKGLS